MSCHNTWSMTRFKLKRIVLLYCLVQILLMDPTSSYDELTKRHTNWMTNKAVMLILRIKFSFWRHQRNTTQQRRAGQNRKTAVSSLFGLQLTADSWWNWLQILEMNTQRDCYKSLPSRFWWQCMPNASKIFHQLGLQRLLRQSWKRSYRELTSD